ncbi:uncharacterized protein AMSG_01979 [Thecamonas trahens ATCC 50062]|uniref:JmjC domain-containing protein n=1 Tax=Thecamonas trahens ATCC 50062 TaxID=461836 RepID=A0A0L0DUQ6_THETB|nr:hypothetical protein AMSG_01979 [Thecamonas trahens ATCC 50062]KNC55965.1 hypothetical protein AMSG_01979 [Thecamonas trahens ATCC 50062]|eukprot:XP_013761012.1 hypothetical protein AMSG_01979 [Thecamonas trahens ATCC 50062]
MDVRDFVVDQSSRGADGLVELRDRPLLIRGSSAAQWPALRRWSDAAAMKKAMAGVELAFRNASAGSPVFVPVGERMLSLGAIDAFEMQTAVGLESFYADDASRGDGDDDGDGWLLYHTGDVDGEWAPVKGDLRVEELELEAGVSRSMVWVGRAGVVANTHYDTSYNLHIQITGAKQWILHPPSASVDVEPFPWLHVHYRQARDMQANHDDALIITVRPGEILYVPPFWWHSVRAVERSYSVSVLSPAVGERSAAELLAMPPPRPPAQAGRGFKARALEVVASARALVFGAGVSWDAVMELVEARYARLPIGSSSQMRALTKAACWPTERAAIDLATASDTSDELAISSGGSNRLTRRKKIDAGAVASRAALWAASRIPLLTDVVVDGREAIATDLMEVIASDLFGDDGRFVGRFWAACGV